jgi:hypothetical protein
LNAAHGLLSCGMPMAEAAMTLARDLHLSRRQAYRYLTQARRIGGPSVVAEPSVPLTLNLPHTVARDLRAYAAAQDLRVSQVVAHAVAVFLQASHKHG